MTTTLSFPENGNEGVGVTGAAGVDGVNAGRAVEGSGARQRQREDRSKDAADVARSGILKRQAATPFGQDAKVASSSGAMAVRSFSALAATSSTASWPLTQTSLTSVASATPGLPEPSGNSEPSAPIALPPHLAAASASNHLTRTHTHNPALSVASSTATTTTTVTTTPTPTPSLLLASRRAPSLASSSSHFKGEINKLVKVHDKSGAKSINQYAVLREIGRGVHGKVKVAQDSTDGSLWAIKIVDKHAKKRFQSRFAFSQSLQSQRLSSTGGGHSTANATRGSSIAGSLGSTTANAGSGSAGALSTTFDAVNNLQLEKIKHEIAIMKKIDHRNVVVLREVIDDPEAAKVYLVLEYMAGGEVEWRDTSRDPPRPVMGPADARRILRDVVCGLEYLHHNGIIHRDIKPANLLWEDAARRRVKISDFGVSVFVDVLARDCSAVQMELAKTAGSPAFFAPELCAVVDDDEDEGEEGTAASARGGAAGDETSTVSFALTTGESVSRLGDVLLGGRRGDVGWAGGGGTATAERGLNGKGKSFSSSESTAVASLAGMLPFAGSSGTSKSGPVHDADLTVGASAMAVEGGELSDFGKRLRLRKASEETVAGHVQEVAAKRQSLITSGLSSLETSPVLRPAEANDTVMAVVAALPPPLPPHFSINDLDLAFEPPQPQVPLPAPPKSSSTPLRASQNSLASSGGGVESGAGYEDDDEADRGSARVAAADVGRRRGREQRGKQRGDLAQRHKSPMSGMERYRMKYRSPGRGNEESAVMAADGSGITFSAAAAIEIGAAIDVWALGVTLFCLIYGRVPFVAETEFELFHVICKSPLVFPDEPTIDDELRDLLTRLMDKNPETRIRLPEVKSHAWVTKGLGSSEQEQWIMDPISTFGRPLTVTEEEVSAAVRPVLMDRLRDGLRKLSLSFAKNLNLKQRSKSLSSMFGKDGSSASPTPSNESAMAAAQVAVAISQRPPTSVQTAKLGSLNGTVSASSLANIHIPPPAPPGHNVFASRSPSIRGKTPVAPGTPRLSTGSWFAPAEDSSIVPHSPQSPRSSSASIALQHLQFMRPASSMMNSPNPATPTPFAEDYIVPILGPASRNGSTAALPAVGSVSNLSQGFRTQAQARTAATRASGTSLATLLAAAGGGTPADAAAFLAMQEQGVDVLKQALVAQQLQQQQHMEGRGSRTGTPTDLAGGSEHHAAAPLPVPVAQQKVRTEPMLDSGAALEKQRRWRERVMLSKFGKTAASSSSSSSSGNSDDKGAERDDEASSLTPVQKVNGSGAAGLPQDMAPRASFLLGESSAEEDTESGVDEFVVRERERVKQWNM